MTFKTLRYWVSWIGVLSITLIASINAQPKTLPIESRYSQALSLFKDGLYEQAYRHFRQFEIDYPDHPNAGDARYYQAESLLAIGRADEAAPLYANFASQYPLHPLADKAQLSLGRYYYEKTQYAESRQQFAQMFQKPVKPEVGSEALYWMAMASLRLSQPDAAIDYFQQLVKAYPQTNFAPNALYLQGKTELERRNYTGATTAFEQLSTQYPRSSLATNTGLALIEANYQLKRYDRVVAEGERRIAQMDGVELERTLILMGESANQLKDYNRAQYYFGNVIKNFPNSTFRRFANWGQAWATHYKGNYVQAATYFSQAREQATDELAHKSLYYEAVNLNLAGQKAAALQRYADLVATFSTGEFTDQAMYELGSANYEAGSYQTAIQYLDQLTVKFPNSSRNGEAYFLLGESFSAIGNAEAASRAFDLASRQNTLPTTLRANLGFRKGWIFYQNKQYVDAITAFGTYFQSSNDPAALFWMADSHVQLGNNDEATRIMNQYISVGKNDPNVNNAYYMLGYIAFNKKQYTEAARNFERFLTNFKETPEQRVFRTDAQLRLGDSYYALKKFDDAVAAYRKVGNEGTIYALFQSGLAYANSGQNNDAITAFRRLIGSYPNSPWAAESQYTIGYLQLQQQQYDAAINEYKRVVQFYPNTPQAAKAQYGIGDALFNQEKNVEAIAAYREVVAKYPTSSIVADALVGMQQAANVAGDAELAAVNTEIETYLRNNSTSAIADELRFKRAENLFQQGQVQEALAGFEAFLQSNRTPQFVPQATFYAGASYILLNNAARGEQLLLQVLSKYPNEGASINASRDLANLYLNVGRYTDALAMFKRLEGYGTSEPELVPEALLGQGQTQLAAGNLDDGKRLLEQVIARYPQSEEAKQAYLRLGNLALQRNQLSEAMTIFQRLGANGNDAVAAEAQFRYGTILLQLNKAQDALAVFNAFPTRFADELDWLVQGYLGKARAHKALGQKTQAIQTYDKVLNEFGDTSFAEIARNEKARL